jgi:hypothetical protein
MKFPTSLEAFRQLLGPWGSNPGDDFGAFNIPGPLGVELRIVASPGDANEDIPWQHVSVSTRNRCPTWKEMCWVKDLFWDTEEAVVQFHPPQSEYVNMHPYCLHLWRPLDGVFPAPPSIAVGFKVSQGVIPDTP